LLKGGDENISKSGVGGSRAYAKDGIYLVKGDLHNLRPSAINAACQWPLPLNTVYRSKAIFRIE